MSFSLQSLKISKMNRFHRQKMFQVGAISVNIEIEASARSSLIWAYTVCNLQEQSKQGRSGLDAHRRRSSFQS